MMQADLCCLYNFCCLYILQYNFYSSILHSCNGLTKEVSLTIDRYEHRFHVDAHLTSYWVWVFPLSIVMHAILIFGQASLKVFTSRTHQMLSFNQCPLSMAHYPMSISFSSNCSEGLVRLG